MHRTVTPNLIAAAFVLVASVNLQAAPPNIIFILADDLGIGDTTATSADCKIATPRLQQLADAGMTFTDAHTSSSVCTPTRYGLLTGRYNWRSRLADGVLWGDSDHLIPADRSTVAKTLQSAGYHTAMIGKWHLGWDWSRNAEGEIDFTGPVRNGPDINGFDQYYGHAGSLDMPPYVWVDTGNVTALPNRTEGAERKNSPYGWYRRGPVGADFDVQTVLPHLIAKSIEYIDQRSKADPAKPFFLYLPLPAPHTPIVPNEPFAGSSGINPYADFVAQVDHHVGEIIDALDERGLTENTMLWFSSDNGCSPQANYDVLAEHGHDPSGPYRGHKADLYEGGHRVPLIVRWPGHIAAGSRSDATVCLTDFHPTAAEVVGQSTQVDCEDGYSILPHLTGSPKSAVKRESLVSHSITGRFAIRQGDWKLLVAPGSGGWSDPRDPKAVKEGLPPMQLYDLSRDVREAHNMIEQHPERADELLQELQRIVDRGRSTPGPDRENDRDVSVR